MFSFTKQLGDSVSKIPSARAEYKRLKREMMETKTKKDEKEKTSSGNKRFEVYQHRVEYGLRTISRGFSRRSRNERRVPRVSSLMHTTSCQVSCLKLVVFTGIKLMLFFT